MVMMGSLMATSEALAGCRWYDAGCKAREAAESAKRRIEEAARAAQAAADQARQQAEAQAAEARRVAEQAAALAAQQAAAARAAAEAAARAALEVARQRAPMQPNEAVNFANARLNQVGSGIQGAAVSSMLAASSGINRAANDVNSGFRRVGDTLDNELKKLNVRIPDVAGIVLESTKPAVNQVKSFDAFRRAMNTNFAKLDGNDMGAIWSIMRSVMESKRPSNEQIADFQATMRDLVGDVSNGCQICPMPGRAGVGISVTISSPTVTGSTGLPIPLGGSVTFSLVQSTYLVNGRPQFVAGYAVNAEATTAVRPIPEVTMGVTWINGELSTSVLPLATLSVAMSTPAVETPYGSFSGGGSVGLTTPDSVYMFLDVAERQKLVNALRNPSQGPAYVIERANQAIRDLENMVRNPALESGITVGLPGTSAMKIKPDGAMVLSLGGTIASF